MISVQENPIISRITIEGNDVLTDEKLLEELDIQPRRVYTRDIAINSTKKLLDIYRLSGRLPQKSCRKLFVWKTIVLILSLRSMKVNS